MNFSKSLTFETGVASFAAAVLLFGALFWAAREPGVQSRDFSVTYVGIRMLHLGLGPKLYNLDEQQKLKASIVPYGEPLIFEHPPFEALMLSPLGTVPYQTAYFIWGIINIAIWVTLPFLLRPYAPVPKEPLGYLILWLLFAPLGVTLFQGQSSLVVLLLYSVAYICSRRGLDFRAGLALGLTLVKFQFVIPFVLIMALRRKWAFLKGFFAMAGALGLLSWVAVGRHGILSYIHLLTSVAGHPDNMSYGSAVDMATVAAFIHATVGKVVGSYFSLILVGTVSAALILWVAWRWEVADRSGDTRNSELLFSAAIQVSLLSGFHMFTHDLSPLMLGILIVLAHVAESRRSRLRIALVACTTVFFLPVLYFELLGWHRFYFLCPLLIAFLFGTMRLATSLGRTSPQPVFLSSTLAATVPGASEA